MKKKYINYNKLYQIIMLMQNIYKKITNLISKNKLKQNNYQTRKK